ncbi:MAG TPA: TlpA disulfide reductase family protein [Terriglobales bacterium]|nr:TlpA disulfide reductase family protein [Terriglobales bacterium]
MSNPPAKATAWNWVIIGIVLIGGLLYLAYSRRTMANTPAAVAATASAKILETGNVAGRTAPAWTLEDVNGKPVSLAQFAGHPVVMDFWATWCGPCQIEMPWWQQLQEQYKSQGLVIVGVSEDNSLTDVQKYLAKNPINYQIVWDNQSIGATYGTPFGLPTTLFINRQGKITERVMGLEGKPELDKAIRGIL